MALFWAALTFRRGEASCRKWVAGVLSQKVLAPDLYCLFFCFPYPTKWRCFFNTHSRPHDVPPMLTATQPWTEPLNCEQINPSSIKLLSRVFGTATRKLLHGDRPCGWQKTVRSIVLEFLNPKEYMNVMRWHKMSLKTELQQNERKPSRFPVSCWEKARKSSVSPLDKWLTFWG